MLPRTLARCGYAVSPDAASAWPLPAARLRASSPQNGKIVLTQAADSNHATRRLDLVCWPPARESQSHPRMA